MSMDAETAVFWDTKVGSDSVPVEAFVKGLQEHFFSNDFFYPTFTHRIVKFVVSADYSTVTKETFRKFVARFGPLPRCLEKCAASLFTASAVLQPWYHGSLGRGDSDSLLMAQPAGSYLIRTSSKDACLVLSFSHVDESGALRIKNCLIHNLGARGYGLVPDPKDEDVYPTVSALLATSASRLVAAIVSDVSNMCADEAEAAAAASASAPAAAPVGAAPVADDPYGSFDPTAAAASSAPAADDPYGSFDPAAAAAASGGGSDIYGNFSELPPGVTVDGGDAGGDVYGAFTEDGGQGSGAGAAPDAKDTHAAAMDAYGSFMG